MGEEYETADTCVENLRRIENEGLNTSTWSEYGSVTVEIKEKSSKGGVDSLGMMQYLVALEEIIKKINKKELKASVSINLSRLDKKQEVSIFIKNEKNKHKHIRLGPYIKDYLEFW